MSDCENNSVTSGQEDQSSLEQLEQAIDLMAEPNGGCFDPSHFHSFRAVSFLLPRRTCAVCSQRLQSVVSFTSNKVVQCVACHMLAHRSCALSKTTQWQEPCPVNYKTVHPEEQEEEISPDPGTSDNLLGSTRDDESDQKDEVQSCSSPSPEESSQNDDSSATPPSGSPNSSCDDILPQDVKPSVCQKSTNGEGEPLSTASSILPTSLSCENILPQEDKVSVCQESTSSEGEPLSTASSILPTSMSCENILPQEDILSVCQESTIGEGEPLSTASSILPTSMSCENILSQEDKLSVCQESTNSEGEPLSTASSTLPTSVPAESEGAIVNKRSYSKVSFPFFSSSILFRAKSFPVSGSDRNGEDLSINGSHSWNGSSPPSCFTEETANTTMESMEGQLSEIVQDGSNPAIQKSCDADVEQTQDPCDADVEQSEDPCDAQVEQPQDDYESSQTLEWTVDGPPVHWASPTAVAKIFPHHASSQILDEDNDAFTDEESPIQFAIHSFATVSRTLHENIQAHFRPVVNRLLLNESVSSSDTQHAAQDTAESSDGCATKSTTLDENSKYSQETNVERMPEETPSNTPDHRRLGLATVAGGIAGGVAGLVIAGPMGGAIGVKFGQTAGILGVVLEGSFTLGVITSGIAAGRHAGEQLQEKLTEKRVLTLSGTGKNQGVLLVRPNVKTDPEWQVFCDKARQSHNRGISFSFLPRESKAAKRDRYERDLDIVTTDEIEIPTGDKVLLLVSRNLNNKESLPGHVYRQLLDKLKERAASRGPLDEIMKSMSQPTDGSVEHSLQGYSTDSIRARRHDAHAVIKYVTATLLEVRPGFAASASMTEYTATAVEALVFGEIYNLVMEEIEAEFSYKDNKLLEKVAAFEEKQAQGESRYENYKAATSEGALKALHQLTEAHSAVDKLRYCVQFLEKISDYFSGEQSTKQTAMGADSLLKLVCQHILVAKLQGIHAQIAFLDEFARDEHLLRGKEGYALVTLQASLHFLDASTDFTTDIFDQEDD